MNESDVQEAIEQQERVAYAIRVGIEVLSVRLMTLAALLLTAVMFGWAMWSGSVERISAAAIFAVAAWCIVKLKPIKE